MNILPKILILGGGFAGQAAARSLRFPLRSRLCRLTVVDRNPFATMIPVLPDVASGRIEGKFATGSIAPLLPPGAEFMQATVTAVNLAAGNVHTEAGLQSFDHLVIAMGSVAMPSAEGWSANASYPLATFGDAMRIRHEFPGYLRRAPQPHVLFSGAGYTGIELAVALARAVRGTDRACRITMLERRNEILSFMNERRRQRVRRVLDRHSVEVRTRCHISKTDGQAIILSSGERIKDVFLCRTEGTRAAAGIMGADLDSLPDGRLSVRRDLSLFACPNVYAAGDSAAIRTQKGVLRKAVNFAIYSGSRAGANIARVLRGKSPRPFHPMDLGWVIPLGDDSVGRAPGRLPLDGKAGLLLHYYMCGFRNFNRRNYVYFAKQALNSLRNE